MNLVDLAGEDAEIAYSASRPPVNVMTNNSVLDAGVTTVISNMVKAEKGVQYNVDIGTLSRNQQCIGSI